MTLFVSLDRKGSIGALLHVMRTYGDAAGVCSNNLMINRTTGGTDEAYRFILYNISKSVYEKTICLQFYRLEFERLKEILDNDKLNVRTEDEVLYIIDAWIGNIITLTLHPSSSRFLVLVLLRVLGFHRLRRSTSRVGVIACATHWSASIVVKWPPSCRIAYICHVPHSPVHGQQQQYFSARVLVISVIYHSIAVFVTFLFVVAG
ncbi:unnamed protein product [Heligmosomoides polygyrus]|uniref:BACK domain-containing protein n=1 Tax=Heligmosomoides polygyrus TaxID=6339 RepID=A0A183FK23_HELPZ|nr:unnamed protein product [Heligmosomoides polygyrus]